MDVRDIIKQTVDELNEQLDKKIDFTSDTKLIGKQAEVSSIELITLVTIIEELINDKINKDIRIVSDRAFSREHSLFRSIGTLTAFVEELVNE